MICKTCDGGRYDKFEEYIDYMTPCPACGGSGRVSEERDTIIAQLAFVEGVSELVYSKYSDDDLQKRLNHLYGDKH